MNCEIYRERLFADPAAADSELAAHEAACSACRAFATRARRAEQLIQHALRFDPAAVGDAQRVSATTNRRLAWAGLTAGFVGAVSIWFAATTSRPTPTEVLVAEVLAHWDHEPEAWKVTNVSVDANSLERVLAGQARIDLGSLGQVSYANSCRVAGQWMSHLVIQSDRGPVMLLVIPEQHVDGPIPLQLPEQGIGGSLRPLGRGSIAVLGEDAQSLAPIERRIDAAIDI
jgi:hypothetical protein